MTIPFLSVLLFALFAVVPSIAVQCDGVVEDQVIDGNLVARGGDCTVLNTVINGKLRGVGATGEIFADNAQAELVNVKDSSRLVLFNSAISGTISHKNSANMVICGSTVSGGINFDSSNVLVIEPRGECGANTITGVVKAVDSTGAKIIGNTLTDVILRRNSRAIIQDSTFNKLVITSTAAEGPITLENITANEVILNDNISGITITNSDITTLKCRRNTGTVTCTGNTVTNAIGQCSSC